MKTSTVVVLVVGVVVIIAGAALYYSIGSPGGAVTTSTSAVVTKSASSASAAAMNVTIASDNLTVGYKSGFWQIALENAGSVPVSAITAFLLTPTRSFICSGTDSSNGLLFGNCPAPSANPLPPGSTVTGTSTGVGPGSAQVGMQYKVAAHITFANGQNVWVNSTVTATSGG
jgi:hypothetical protein